MSTANPNTACALLSWEAISEMEKLNRFLTLPIKLFTILRLSFSDPIPCKCIFTIKSPTIISCSWMKLFVYALKPLLVYVCIDLCRRDISMAEHLLHAPQIRAAA